VVGIKTSGKEEVVVSSDGRATVTECATMAETEVTMAKRIWGSSGRDGVNIS